MLVSLGVIVLVVAVLALVNRHGTNNTANRTVIVTGTPSRSNVPESPSVSKSSGSPTTRSSSPTSAPAGSTSASSSPPAAGALPVVVLNNTRLSGLGARAAAELQAQGYTVTSVGNYRNNIVSTCAYYDPSTPGAEQAAAALQSKFSWIARTKAKFDGLPAGPVVLVLTADIP